MICQHFPTGFLGVVSGSSLNTLCLLEKREVDFIDMSNFSAGFPEAVLDYVDNTLFW